MIGFGILEGAVTQFLEKRGFAQVQDADNKFLQTTYFKGGNANQRWRTGTRLPRRWSGQFKNETKIG